MAAAKPIAFDVQRLIDEVAGSIGSFSSRTTQPSPS